MNIKLKNVIAILGDEIYHSRSLIADKDKITDTDLSAYDYKSGQLGMIESLYALLEEDESKHKSWNSEDYNERKDMERRKLI